jgi:hypothetical protein
MNRNTSNVARECRQHRKSPGRNHAIEIRTGFFEGERPEPFVLVAPSRRVIDIANSIYAPQWGGL